MSASSHSGLDTVYIHYTYEAVQHSVYVNTVNTSSKNSAISSCRIVRGKICTRSSSAE